MKNPTIDTLQHGIYIIQCRVLILELAITGLQDKLGEEVSLGLSDNLFQLSEHLEELSNDLGGLKSQVNAANVLEAASRFANN